MDYYILFNEKGQGEHKRQTPIGVSPTKTQDTKTKQSTTNYTPLQDKTIK